MEEVEVSPRVMGSVKRKTASIAFRKSVERRQKSVSRVDPRGIFLWFIEHGKSTWEIGDTGSETT